MSKFLHFGLCLWLFAGTAFAQGAPLPWGQPSDMVAWEVFVQVTAPSGNPQSKQVEFETWASDQDIYASSPPRWPTVGAPKTLQVSVLRNARPDHSIRPFVIIPSQCAQNYDPKAAAEAGFPATGCIGEEVRRNWASFQYIVANHLYSKAGLALAFQRKFKVDLPADAIEVKADWARVSDVMAWLHLSEQQVRQLYYVNSATEAGKTTDFALLAFHFSSKQIKDWVWADFEHQMNPGRCDDTGCYDSFGAAAPVVQPRSTPNQYYGTCIKTSAVNAMFSAAGLDPVWKNYCLKGSQITFVQQNGKPTILGNSVIERINAGVPVLQSSCISCHGYASFDNTGRANGMFANNPVGNLDIAKLQGYTSNDFLWGILAIPRKR